MTLKNRVMRFLLILLPRFSISRSTALTDSAFPQQNREAIERVRTVRSDAGLPDVFYTVPPQVCFRPGNSRVPPAQKSTFPMRFGLPPPCGGAETSNICRTLTLCI